MNMTNYCQLRKSGNINCSGFTLIEMAVVMVVAGIIVSVMATVLPSLLQAGKNKKIPGAA